MDVKIKTSNFKINPIVDRKMEIIFRFHNRIQVDGEGGNFEYYIYSTNANFSLYFYFYLKYDVRHTNLHLSVK